MRHSFEQMIDLTFDRTDFDFRIHQPGRANDLFDHLAAGFGQFVWPGRRRNVDALADPFFELLKIQRPVVERRRQTKSIFDQRLSCVTDRQRTCRAPAELSGAIRQ